MNWSFFMRSRGVMTSPATFSLPRTRSPLRGRFIARFDAGHERFDLAERAGDVVARSAGTQPRPSSVRACPQPTLQPAELHNLSVYTNLILCVKISNHRVGKYRVKALKKIQFTANSEELGRLIGFSMDVLEFCTEDGLSSLRVAGWIAARGATVNTIRIHSGYGGTRYGTAFLEVNVPRSDVVAVFPGGDISENCGFQGVLPVDGLGENFSLIVLAAQTNTPESTETLFLVGEILGQQQPTLQTPISSSLAPICLTCMGRTGSTALMRILSMHPDIVVAGAYPFETKYAQTAVRSALGELKALLSEGVACIEFQSAVRPA